MGGFVRGGGYIRLLALAAAELKLVHDDAQLMARLVVLRPLRVTQLAVDGDLGALDEVLGQLLGAGAEQGALDEHGASTYSPSAFLRFSLTATVNPATARPLAVARISTSRVR